MSRILDSQVVIRNALASIGSGISSRLSTVFGLLDTKITSMDATITANVIPPGAIMPYGGTSAPTGWLMCDGSSQLRASYPDLYTAIGNAFGTADGTHFNLPDMRGKFVRGRNAGTGNDPDAAGRTAQATGGNTGDNVGSVQADDLKSHFHRIESVNNVGGGSYAGLNTTFNFNSSSPNGYTNGQAVNVIENTGGNETRPINVNVNYIIKT